MGHHTAPFKNWNAITPKIIYILNFECAIMFLGSFLTGAKFQEYILNNSGFFVQGVWQKYLSKDEEPRNNGCSTCYWTQGNLILTVNSVYFVFGLLLYFIIKCDRYYYRMWQLVYHKMRQMLIYKMRPFYYKLSQSLQNALILLQIVTVLANCDVYYKIRRYNLGE